MASTVHKSYFTDDDLAVLQEAFDLACSDLHLSRVAVAAREQLGVILFQIAESGEMDRGELRRRAVECLQASTIVWQPEFHPATLVSFARSFSPGRIGHQAGRR
ncbi:hypothetical protein [Hyphomicrobium sp.]|uniref:hypothetical protein n=1 Tax=Hyphomicrobium sp. TaxID=82 RepID=UPI002E329FD8|nr:hypothetical protein [Hyphomicrobium sp.]HEX2842675.1 hypothetical protein [Hyphomicrobium sp.]